MPDEDIQFLSLEQLHDDLVQLKSSFDSKLETLGADIAYNLPEQKEIGQLDVVVKNPTLFDGKVEVQNELTAKITNLDQVIIKLNEVIQSNKDNKTDEVSVKNQINLDEVSGLLKKLLLKDTAINVKAPIVKVNNPDKINIANFPTNPKDAIAVRLSDGDKFINELTKIVSSGGVNISTLSKEDTVKKLLGFGVGEYDTVDLGFTDATKLTLSTIIYKKSGATLATITVTSPDGTTTRFAKS